MKNLKIFFTLTVFALLTACGPSKQSTAVKNQPSSDGVSDTTGTIYNADVNTSTNTRKPNIEKPTTTTSNRDPNRLEGREKNVQDMYSSLNMTQEQIARYEKESKDYMDTWRKNNPNNTMNNYEQTEYRDRILKSTLDDDQYKEYKQWAKDNANKN
ncbi:hypothetical protein [Aequorivita capsosiphonis]|uniref:hypothetical protein n=1 Tax=Aequorivita capsosiphonis TaxID=487317 RepID=UPI00042891C9|nr:hypothetical protein [Aequorivita capsosiphonis]